MPMQLMRWRTAPLRKSPTGRAPSPRSRQGDAALTNAHAHPEDSAPHSRLLKHGIPNSPSDAYPPAERMLAPENCQRFRARAAATDSSAVYDPDRLAGISRRPLASERNTAAITLAARD